MVPVVAPDEIVRRPMSYEEFLELPGGVRAEWVDGEALRLDDGEWSGEASLDDDHPSATFDFGEHGTATIELAEILGPPA